MTVTVNTGSRSSISSKSRDGAIAGSVAFIVILTLAAFFYRRHRANKGVIEYSDGTASKSRTLFTIPFKSKKSPLQEPLDESHFAPFTDQGTEGHQSGLIPAPSEEQMGRLPPRKVAGTQPHQLDSGRASSQREQVRLPPNKEAAQESDDNKRNGHTTARHQPGSENAVTDTDLASLVDVASSTERENLRSQIEEMENMRREVEGMEDLRRELEVMRMLRAHIDEPPPEYQVEED
ncbi:hypothetical protein GYMLUDRAFT_55762 [Collybiopsis luxurians FD-317 M1]|nr:hypothetical protein GYMLUDRAFT_55762 [Collybiopsis luxurians FD-317 M1]